MLLWTDFSSKNYKWSDNSTGSKTFKCKLDPKPVDVIWESATSYVYDGSAHPSQPQAIGVNGEKITIAYNTETNASDSSYTSTASCSGVSGGGGMCMNYSLGNTTKTFKIERAKTATTGSCGSGEYSLGSSMVSGGDYVTYSNNTASSAGSKTITVTPDSNHAFSDGTITKNVSCTITKVIQKNTQSCSTCSSCANSSCSCKTYYCSPAANDPLAPSSCTDGASCATHCSRGNCKVRNSCANCSSCGCSSWGDPTAWSDVESCSSGESSDHSTYTNCQTIYRIS